MSSEWQDRLGVGSRLRWPLGLGAKGNEGVSQLVHDTTGALGYVELAYALKQRIALVQLKNRAGRVVQADETSVRAALASARWSRPSFYEMLTDREGDDSWPIVGVSFALIHREQADRTDAEETLRFLDWIYHGGAPLAERLHYVTLEDTALIERIESSWQNISDDEGRLLWKNR
jgi:phosphate transport system substrate-binding protein